MQADGMTDLLMAPAKLKDQIPGISGTRNLTDNISDLKAQVAANNKGIGLVKELIEEYSLEVVQAYMKFIQVRPLAISRFKKHGQSCILCGTNIHFCFDSRVGADLLTHLVNSTMPRQAAIRPQSLAVGTAKCDLDN